MSLLIDACIGMQQELAIEILESFDREGKTKNFEKYIDALYMVNSFIAESSCPPVAPYDTISARRNLTLRSMILSLLSDVQEDDLYDEKEFCTNLAELSKSILLLDEALKLVLSESETNSNYFELNENLRSQLQTISDELRSNHLNSSSHHLRI